MTEVPLQKITVSDFRRLDGTHTFPLDAPIVLLHGPNGSGKTSVLSAIELALTGEIRSMFRQDPRYTAHLPFQGQEFATLSIEVSEDLASSHAQERMTVGGSRIEGTPALGDEASRFYSERCYLDQVSLGQLLDLYQYREGKEDSALARFVNELLGLEQLDALRSGLAPAADFRNLKNAANQLIEAEMKAKQADTDLLETSQLLEEANASLAQLRSDLTEAAIGLGLARTSGDPGSLTTEVAGLLSGFSGADELATAQELQRSLTEIGGRLSAISKLQSVLHLDRARAELTAALTAVAQWRSEHQAAIEAWTGNASKLAMTSPDGTSDALIRELTSIDAKLAEQRDLIARATEIKVQVADGERALASLEQLLADAQEQAGSLAEGLAALRPHLSDDVCPVCGRDFGEVSSSHLTVHVEAKINDLTSQGAQLLELRAQRGAVAAELQRHQEAVAQVEGAMLSQAELEGIASRRRALSGLKDRFDALSPIIATGRELQASARQAEGVVQDLEAAAVEARSTRADLERSAEALGEPTPGEGEPLSEIWQRLSAMSEQQVRDAQAQAARLGAARSLLEQLLVIDQQVGGAKDSVAQAATRKRLWDTKVAEAKRRQKVAREVAQAASTARATIVQRVFTESLNEVWQSVFARLAPRESFVPAFGIPSLSRSGLELTLQTVHSSGQIGGSPQMMLSAGNLNTAALSLFIALHLGVNPIVPCLVFDDPVQSMDEVHISQFAGLMRVLSKHHGRQVVIAVHERELFDYLSLELSPAFEGDELITIDLGARSAEIDAGIRRHTWTPDASIAV